jgi:hypothetical protein
MAKSKRSAEEVCVEYAIAAESVREQTRIMRDNPCTEQSGGELDLASGYSNGAQESCMSRHWNVVTGPPPNYREEPELTYDGMCEPCKIRLKAFDARRECKRRLGAAKRAVEAIGKREAARG